MSVDLHTAMIVMLFAFRCLDDCFQSCASPFKESGDQLRLKKHPGTLFSEIFSIDEIAMLKNPQLQIFKEFGEVEILNPETN